MQAGKLDRRITLQGATESQSDSGEIIYTWGNVATVWAELVSAKGNERFANAQLIGKAITTFRFRYSTATKVITTKHRVVYDGREYDIVDVREPKRRETLEIDCTVPSEEPVAA